MIKISFTCRIALLSFSIFCVFGTIILVVYMYQHRKLKVFKVASPIFLSITLLGCAIMYLEVRILRNLLFQILLQFLMIISYIYKCVLM